MFWGRGRRAAEAAPPDLPDEPEQDAPNAAAEMKEFGRWVMRWETASYGDPLDVARAVAQPTDWNLIERCRARLSPGFHARAIETAIRAYEDAQLGPVDVTAWGVAADAARI